MNVCMVPYVVCIYIYIYMYVICNVKVKAVVKVFKNAVNFCLILILILKNIIFLFVLLVPSYRYTFYLCLFGCVPSYSI